MKTNTKHNKPAANKTASATPESNAFFADPVDPCVEGRALGLEVITHLLLWMSDAPTLESRGLRATVALYCVRPDLIDGLTFDQIGELAGCTPQAVHKLANDFRANTGMQS